MRSEPLLHLRRVGLDPAEDRGVCDLDAAVLQHLFRITVSDREHQVPVGKDQAAWVKPNSVVLPALAPAGHVRPLLLGGV